MKFIPSSGSEWVRMLLFPFKVFVLCGWPMIKIKRHIIGYRMDTDMGLVSIVLFGYIVSFFVLAIGAMIQDEIGPRKAYLSTCRFIVVLFLFGWLLLPYLGHT